MIDGVGVGVGGNGVAVGVGVAVGGEGVNVGVGVKVGTSVGVAVAVGVGGSTTGAGVPPPAQAATNPIINTIAGPKSESRPIFISKFRPSGNYSRRKVPTSLQRGSRAKGGVSAPIALILALSRRRSQ